MILVVGATGTVGSEVARQLSEKGASYRVLTRDAKKAGNYKNQGIEVAEGDVGKPETLGDALAGVDHVLLCTTFDKSMHDQHVGFAKAAKAAGVQHIVRLSALSANANSGNLLQRVHGETDRDIADIGLDVTILRPHYFMQNFFGNAGSIVGEGAFYAPMRDGKISLIDVRDIASVAVKTLTETGHAGKIYDLTGPEALSFGDIAARFTDALGKTVQYVDVPPQGAQQSMEDMGMPGWFAEGLVGLMDYFAQGKAAAVSPDVKNVTGRDPISFDRFLADNKAAFTA
ncbi:SDR family oxidoreductase [bacterium]|nr:SDR family oxidoreductase [bacterium]